MCTYRASQSKDKKVSAKKNKKQQHMYINLF